MPNKTYTFDLNWTGTQYDVTVPELVGVTAYGATIEEAIENARHAIHAARLKELEAAKAV